MPTLHGLPPIETPDARALVLGSMPGGMSLRTGRYYAHPRNLFWQFMDALVGASPALAYGQRVACLRRAGVALWDVIATCERDGSLDTAIRDPVANDFAAFLGRHGRLRAVLFNGAKAEETFRRQVRADVVPAGVVLSRLPSTSPANRSIATQDKLDQWRAAFLAAGIEPAGSIAGTG